MTSRAASITTRLSLTGISASTNRPMPIIAMPAVIGTLGSNSLVILPDKSRLEADHPEKGVLFACRFTDLGRR
jgi:hypothetical protein